MADDENIPVGTVDEEAGLLDSVQQSIDEANSSNDEES